MNLQESISNWRAPVYVRIKRSEETYAATNKYITAELERLVKVYNKTDNDQQTQRLLRDDIDSKLRRYHEYCIKERIGAHYIDKDVDVGNSKTWIFEHMIPASSIRDMLIAGIITPVQACNAPICLLSRERDQLLKDKGWNSKTPDEFNFWQRYEYCFETKDQFQTWDGQPITVNNLQEHFEYLGVA